MGNKYENKAIYPSECSIIWAFPNIETFLTS